MPVIFRTKLKTNSKHLNKQLISFLIPLQKFSLHAPLGCVFVLNWNILYPDCLFNPNKYGAFLIGLKFDDKDLSQGQW